MISYVVSGLLLNIGSEVIVRGGDMGWHAIRRQRQYQQQSRVDQAFIDVYVSSIYTYGAEGSTEFVKFFSQPEVVEMFRNAIYAADGQFVDDNALVDDAALVAELQALMDARRTDETVNPAENPYVGVYYVVDRGQRDFAQEIGRFTAAIRQAVAHSRAPAQLIIERQLERILANLRPVQAIHLKTVPDLLTRSGEQDFEFLYTNNLAYFDDVETSNFEKLIGFLEETRMALFLGQPATGKSISVVAIASLLQHRGYTVYYYSFKQQASWDAVWEEMSRQIGADVVFVLDDAHLQPGKAGDFYGWAQNRPTVRVLFISRIVDDSRSAGDYNIYADLADQTVQTEDPDIAEKVHGIVRKFQAYYRQEYEEEGFAIGNVDVIVEKTHRNLILLREYLRVWKEQPRVALSDITESELYVRMYRYYFEHQGIRESWEQCLLQYLALYCFEVSFYANPQYLEQTEALAENSNRIVPEQGRLYSLYHGEYAFLLLKAYHSEYRADFDREYGNWIDFFVHQLHAYIAAFEASGRTLRNLLLILNSVRHFSRKAHTEIPDPSEIFVRLMTIPEIEQLALAALRADGDENEKGHFMGALIALMRDRITDFFPVYLGNGATPPASAIFYYVQALAALSGRAWQAQQQAFRDATAPHLDGMLRGAHLTTIAGALGIMAKKSSPAAAEMLNMLTPVEAAEKTEQMSSSAIGYCLSIMQRVDRAYAQALLAAMPEDRMIANAHDLTFPQIVGALSGLFAVDLGRAEALLAHFTDAELVARMGETVFPTLSNALNIIGRISRQRAEGILRRVGIERMIQAAKEARPRGFVNGLSRLGKVSPTYTATLLEAVGIPEMVAKIRRTGIVSITQILLELKAVTPSLPDEILAEIPDSVLLAGLRNCKVGNVGTAVRDLYNVAPERVAPLLEALEAPLMVEKMRAARAHDLVHVFSNLTEMDPQWAAGYLELVGRETILDKLRDADLTKLATSLAFFIKIVPNITEMLFGPDSTLDIVDRFEETEVSYGARLAMLAGFAKADAELGRRLVLALPTVTLLDRTALEDLETFNQLARILVLIQADPDTPRFAEIIEMGVRISDRILTAGNFPMIRTLLSLLNLRPERATALVAANRSRLARIVVRVHEWHRGHIAGFIQQCHYADEAIGLYLLEHYRQNYPDAYEYLGFTYWYLASSYERAGDPESRLQYLEIALTYLEQADRPHAAEKVRAQLDEASF